MTETVGSYSVDVDVDGAIEEIQRLQDAVVALNESLEETDELVSEVENEQSVTDCIEDESDDMVDEHVAALEEIFDLPEDEVEQFGDWYGEDPPYYRVRCEPETSVSGDMMLQLREQGYAVEDILMQNVEDILMQNVGQLDEEPPRLRLVVTPE